MAKEGAPREGDAAAGSRGHHPLTAKRALGGRLRPAREQLIPDSISHPAIALALFLLALAYFSLTLDRTLNLRDEGYLLRMSSRVAQGEVPHRDFIDVYGPGVLTTTGLALHLGDDRILVVRWWLAIIKAGAVVLVYSILCRLTPRGVAMLGALLATAYWGRASLNLNTPYASLYTIPICLLSLLLLLRAGERRTRLAYVMLGCAAGLAILFKQSVGMMNAYGIAMAISAVAMLGGDGGSATGQQRSGATRLTLAAWGLAAVAPLLPASAFLRPRDYLLHFLPIHLLMGLVALGVARHGLGTTPKTILRRRLVPYAAGIALVLCPVAGLYGWWGALPELVYDTFVFPTLLRNYYLSSALPPPGLSSFAIGGLLLLAGAMLGLRRRAQAGLVLAAGGVLLMGVAYLVLPRSNPDLYTLPIIWRTASAFDWVESSAILLAATVLIAPAVLDRGHPDRGPLIRLALPIALVQAFLCFQTFPRAGHNVWMVQGAFVPLLVVVAHRVYLRGTGAEASRGRRVAAALVCAVIPLWLVAPVVAPVLWPGPAHAFRRALRVPHTQGIEPTVADIQEEHLDDVEKLIARLDEAHPPKARLLLFSNQQMIHFLSGRQHLIPRREYILFSAASGMVPLKELSGLADGRLLEELRRNPDTIVVMHRDPAAGKLRRSLPRITRFIEQNYEIDVQIGVYRVLRPRSPTKRASTR